MMKRVRPPRSRLRRLRVPRNTTRGRRAMAGAIGATKFDVNVAGKQFERSYAQIRTMIDDSALLPEEKALSQRIFLRLAKAESQVHRIPLDAVQFHEVGAADAICDSVQRSLRRLNCDAVDVLLIHSDGRDDDHAHRAFQLAGSPARKVCYHCARQGIGQGAGRRTSSGARPRRAQAGPA